MDSKFDHQSGKGIYVYSQAIHIYYSYYFIIFRHGFVDILKMYLSAAPLQVSSALKAIRSNQQATPGDIMVVSKEIIFLLRKISVDI